MELSVLNKFLIMLSNEVPRISDCIVILEGDGFSRVDHTVTLYNMGYSKKIIFSGGLDNKQSGAFNSKIILPELLSLGIKEKDIIIEEKSQNTYEQAIEVLRILHENNWQSIILVASHYHQYRAFLTFLKVLIDQELDKRIKIFNSSAKNLSWYEHNEWGRRIDLLSDEFEKISLYYKKGNVASIENALTYFKWRDS